MESAKETAAKLEKWYSGTVEALTYGGVHIQRLEMYYHVGRYVLMVDEGPGERLDAFIRWAKDLPDLLAVVDRFHVIRYFKRTDTNNDTL